jgi:Cu-Zn family superoxide dismutase
LKTTTLCVLGLCAALLAETSTTRAAGSEGKSKATAVVEARSGASLDGKATFRAKQGKVTLELSVRHAPPGTHAVHLHEKGDCSDPEAKSAGAHWNPAEQAHGRWGGTCHLGDIGNLVVDAKGNGKLKLTTELWTIGGPAASDVLGKSVIIHATADDFVTQPHGNAGGRIGCGVVR